MTRIKATTTTLILTFFLIVGCKKEVSIEDIGNAPKIFETVSSIVFEGNYGGYNPLGFDSTAIQYSNGKTVLDHYDQNAKLIAKETLRYDNEERVVSYRIDLLPLKEYDVIHYQYTGTNSFPSKIFDTVYTSGEKVIFKVILEDQDNDGNLKRLTLQQHYQAENPPLNGMNTIYAWLDSNNNLVKVMNPVKDEQSDYFFNTSGVLIDSCFTSNGNSNDNIFCYINYSNTDNPLASVAKQIYKNLKRYNLTDLLSSHSIFESTLGISYLNVELFQPKIPSRVRIGYERGLVEEEFTYNFYFLPSQVQGVVIKDILINHKDLTNGAVSQTRLRLNY